MSHDRLADAKALLQRLIAFESVSNRSNLPLIAFVEDYLGALGVAVRRAPNGAGDKTALMATVGPGSRAGSSSQGIRRRAGRGTGVDGPAVCAA